MTVTDVPDLDAHHYENHSKPQYDRAQELISSLKIDPSDSVLDIGCGYGNIIAEISQMAAKGQSIGIDASSNMITLAREKFPKSEFPNLEFHHMKAEEMNFPESNFDTIICTSCFLWIREPKKALELMYKSLKPGGRLVILTYLKESPYADFLERTLESSFSSYKKHSATQTMLSLEEHKQVLISHGLELEIFSPEQRFLKYKNEEDLKDYIRGWLTCYVPLPLELHESFLDKAAEESISENVSPTKNEIVLPHQLLAIKGRKPL